MNTRNGKVARLPFEIREELNHRLLENEPARSIIGWLNAHSTVRTIMDRFFEGRPVTEQNISEWRQGGYEEWLAFRNYLGNSTDLSENAARVSFTGINAEHLLLVLTASYADLLQKWDTTEEITFNRRLIVLQHLTKTALAMRRSEQRDARLELDRERLEILREKHADSSPSSFSSRDTSSSSARASLKYPFDPKAPEIHRPPTPQPSSQTSDDWLWPSSAPASKPCASGAYPPSPAVAADPACSVATPLAFREPETNGGRERGEPNPSDTKSV